MNGEIGAAGLSAATPTVCIVCGTANAPSARFCGACGTRLLVHCWSCGTAAPVGQRFCVACGTEIVLPASAGGQVAVAEPRGTALAAATLSHAAALAVPAAQPASAGPAPEPAPPASAGAPVAVAPVVSVVATPAPRPLAVTPDPTDDEDDRLVEERRLVTVLFADIVGFTTLSERLDPEDVRELSASVLARLAESVSLYGGTIDKFMGDAVMALFGAPLAHEDDPLRAVHAALAMHRAMTSLGQTDAEGNAIQLRLRIGINTGEVIAGRRDVGGHREYTVFGDVVNTAARLQVAASPGSILLGEATAHQVSTVFELEAVAPLQLKGKAQPVPAYQVRGKLESRVPALGEQANGHRPPLVGRLAELHQLRQELQDLSRGRGQITAVVGEHGVGKSRLLDEAREYALELGLGWVAASAPSHAQGLSYRLIRETLARQLSLRPDGADGRLAEMLAERLERLDLRDQLMPLAFVLGIDLDDDLTAGLSAQKLQWKLVDAMRQVLKAFAAERPLVLVLDALQWADPSSIDLLIELMAVTDECPVLFVYVFTPEPDAPSWQLKEQAARSYPHRYTEIALGPLPERAARELMCSLLACAETPAHVEELVLARTDGNPFFIEEMLRELVDSGALRRDGERWVADGDIQELQLPSTLVATVMARIDRLPAGVRRTLQVAAVIGRELSERVLRRVVDGGAELDRHLREALRAGLLREEAVIPERRFAFTQALIQEAAARSLLVRRRREIHVQIGWALEEIYADDLEEQYGELSRHFWEGESWERAFRYARLAAEQAAAAFANDEAVLHFTIALESAQRSAAGAAPEVIATIAERRGDVRALIGAYDAALADYQEAMEHRQAALDGDASESQSGRRAACTDVGTLALKIARLRSYQGKLAETRAALELAFSLLPPECPDLSSAWSLWATLHIWASDAAKAAEAGRRALEIAQQRGTFQHLSEAYETLTHPGMLGLSVGDQAVLADEWVRLARDRPEDRPALLKALIARSLIHVYGLWRFDERLLADTREALEIARATGSVAGENTARGVLGAGLFLMGEWSPAVSELRRSAGQPTTIVGVGAIFEWWLMLALTLQGELDAAAAQMETWLADVKNTHRRVVMHALLGWNRQLAGDADAARAALARAAEAAAELGCAHCELTYQSIAAEVLAELGDVEAAAPLAVAAREAGERFGRSAAILAADRADALVALAQGDPEGARDRLGPALDRAEQLGQPYELARTLHVLALAFDATGDRAGGAVHRELAMTIFDRLGAAPHAVTLRKSSGEPVEV